MLASFLGVPIVGDGEVLGALWLANRKDRNAFTENDERLIGLLAAHAAIALENARLYERSRELSVVEERNRIARELHDAVAQKLFSVRLTAQAAAALVRRDPERAVDEVSRVGDLAGEALAELRSVVVELRPADLEEGLAGALRKHVEVLDRVHAAEVRWTGSDLAPLPADVEDALLRVAQEALHNALRHGKPCLVEVILREEAGAVVLEVRDDGVGFAVEEERRGSRRLGLASMSERAESVGGRLTVASQPMAGTTVRLEVRRG
jgi:signal transduction histidine kinase